VLGLIKAFGIVALHGNEGFRAEMAMVTCVFTDEIALAPAERVWRRLVRRFQSNTSELGNGSKLEGTHAMKRLAGHYGVPLVSLQSALSVGLLSELGVAQDAIKELQGWLTQGRQDAWRRRPTQHA
jgi:hypothetical protein